MECGQGNCVFVQQFSHAELTVQFMNGMAEVLLFCKEPELLPLNLQTIHSIIIG